MQHLMTVLGTLEVYLPDWHGECGMDHPRGQNESLYETDIGSERESSRKLLPAR